MDIMFIKVEFIKVELLKVRTQLLYSITYTYLHTYLYVPAHTLHDGAQSLAEGRSEHDYNTPLRVCPTS